MADSFNQVRARRRVLILGAAGRDFHDFNMVYRSSPEYEVVGFTAAQIPNIADRTYPPDLAGPLYPAGVPIFPEAEWEEVVDKRRVDEVVFAYSDISHVQVMHLAARAVALGADFRLLGARSTMLQSFKPVVSICAVRTGCGKSPTARFVARTFREAGQRVAVIRHPMPYGDLSRQAVQRFASLQDIDRAACTVEEREEYEPHIRAGDLVYAGVDYGRILRDAEVEADVIVWDGGNNDLPFIQPDLELVLVDPHRPGDETTYYPGEANLLRADAIIITKVDTASPNDVRRVMESARAVNPNAAILEVGLPPVAADAQAIEGKRVLVVEDGPTLTHGGMAYGAGTIAARKYGAAALVDPRPYATGSIHGVFESYPSIGPVLPAMGYSSDQVQELRDTIDAVPCDLVVNASPVDLGRLLQLRQPVVRVSYEIEESPGEELSGLLLEFLARWKPKPLQ